MKKKITTFAFLVVAFILVLWGCGQQATTIDTLLEYFKNSGLSVTTPPILNEKDKVAVDKTRKVLKRMGAGSKSKLVEVKTMMLDSVKVQIRRYQDAASAQTEYENYIKKEERKKKRARERNTVYNKSIYLYNSTFVLQIRYYKIKSLKDFKPVKLDVPAEKLKEIKEAFNKFK